MPGDSNRTFTIFWEFSLTFFVILLKCCITKTATIMSLSEISDRVLNKYFIHRNSFFNGFWFFFGLEENPFKDAVKQIHEKDVKQALNEDWQSVQGDFVKVFEGKASKLGVKK